MLGGLLQLFPTQWLGFLQISCEVLRRFFRGMLHQPLEALQGGRFQAVPLARRVMRFRQEWDAEIDAGMAVAHEHQGKCMHGT